MANMANIVDFNNSDGLPPEVVKKLNNNFWHVVDKIRDPGIVMTSGATLPEPRTDEALFYNVEDGSLYIWSGYDGPGSDGSEWQKVEQGFIRVEDRIPVSDEPSTHGEKVWYSTSDNQFYILAESSIASLPLRWYALDSYIAQVAIAAVNQ